MKACVLFLDMLPPPAHLLDLSAGYQEHSRAAGSTSARDSPSYRGLDPTRSVPRVPALDRPPADQHPSASNVMRCVPPSGGQKGAHETNSLKDTRNWADRPPGENQCLVFPKRPLRLLGFLSRTCTTCSRDALLSLTPLWKPTACTYSQPACGQYPPRTSPPPTLLGSCQAGPMAQPAKKGKQDFVQGSRGTLRVPREHRCQAGLRVLQGVRSGEPSQGSYCSGHEGKKSRGFFSSGSPSKHDQTA